MEHIMKPHWLDSLAAGAAFFTLLGGLSFGLAKAEAAPLVIPGIGPEEQDLLLPKRAKRSAEHVQMSVPDPVEAVAEPQPLQQPMQVAANVPRGTLGGGLIELLLTGRDPTQRVTAREPYLPRPASPAVAMNMAPAAEEVRKSIDPQFMRQEVDYSGAHNAGTIVIDTPHKFLYLVQGHGRAIRYGIGVGRPGFEWSGVKTVSRKAEWPDWTPPPEMLKRRPDLPQHMEGGPANPLGARAMYLGSSMYRIHGTNEPDTIGTNVSSGCIRMMNEDVTDLYEKVRVGTKVIVM